MINPIAKANNDWKDMLNQYNIDENLLNKKLNSTEFQNKAGNVSDDGNKSYTLKKSDIHGRGLFINKQVQKNEVIGYALRNNKRTFLGRYTNHSPEYNAKFLAIKNSSDMITVAYKKIKKGEEILVDYRNHTFKKEYYNKNLI
tara:strand:+ start:3702 stop:4130 length:429 start_codon:yes stop_codon:yes gene_type:complete